MAEKKLKKQLTPDDVIKLLNSIYKVTVDGLDAKEIKNIKIPLDGFARPVHEIANDYLSKHKTVEDAANAFIRNQIKKCTATSFLTGLGGILNLPIAISANIGGVMLLQMQMVATLAYMGGHDLKSDQVKTNIFMYTVGLSIDQSLKKNGAKMSAKIISQAPGEVLKIINQRIGSKMLVKLTEKTAVNTTKAVPIVGSVVGSSFDYFETKQLAKIAYKEFIANKEENPEAPLFDDDDVYNPDYIGI